MPRPSLLNLPKDIELKAGVQLSYLRWARDGEFRTAHTAVPVYGASPDMAYPQERSAMLRNSVVTVVRTYDMSVPDDVEEYGRVQSAAGLGLVHIINGTPIREWQDKITGGRKKTRTVMVYVEYNFHFLTFEDNHASKRSRSRA